MGQKVRKDQTRTAKAAGTPAVLPEVQIGDSPKNKRQFPLVGIGASAGGLEALEQFLSHVPDNSGLAFVVVQHLDPTYKGMLPELLQRSTTMKVVQANDNQRVERNCVYVIPPNKDLAVLHGVLQLTPPVAPRGLRLPIDSFLRSLAEDYQELAVGVILSGMGSDGTLGLRAIKERAGVALVQAPGSAKFDGMPSSAISASLADIVASAEELPEKILTYLKHIPPVATPELERSDTTSASLERVIVLLQARTGHDFSEYKSSTLYRRIGRRMGIHEIDKLNHYVRYLQENPAELDLLFKELLIGVTSFFRDPEEWGRLRDKLIPDLIAASQPGREIRAWVVGCSTGEEAYSLAIVFKEAMEKAAPHSRYNLQVFATDLDADAIIRARQGIYPASIAADVTADRLSKFFTEENGSYVVNKGIREMVIFAQQNVIKDPPFTKMDIVTCRNLLIYMEHDLQKMVMRLFYYSLMVRGVLFLGSSETVGGGDDLFKPIHVKSRLFTRIESEQALGPFEFSRSFIPARSGGARQKPPDLVAPPASIQALTDQLLLQTYSPAAVLVNGKGDVLYINGRTGKYLEPAAGKANWNIFAMAREEIRFELIGAFQKAIRQKERLVLKNLVFGTNGGKQTIDLTIHAIHDPEPLRGMIMIIFTDVPPATEKVAAANANRANRSNSRLVHSEAELQRAREEMQGVKEEMQTSQEELRSAIEELQSANEELQSANEELTTSREEMQSLNEELQTVNGELEINVAELSRSSDDMKNLLDSTEVATVFLDSALRVRRFTSKATKILRLIQSDIGRSVTDIASDLVYPELPDDVHEVLRTLVFVAKELPTRDGRWFAVRVMPYRTAENKIDGVVITCADVTTSKLLEAELLQLLDSLPNLVLTFSKSGPCERLNHQWVEFTGVSEADQLGYDWLEQVEAQDRERVGSELRTGIKTGNSFTIAFLMAGLDKVARKFLMQTVPIRDEHRKIIRWYGAISDIDELARAQDALRLSDQRFQSALEDSQLEVSSQDRDLRYTWVFNPHPGFHPPAEIGKTDSELFSAKDSASLSKLKRQVLKTGVKAREVLRTTFDGQTYAYDITVYPFMGAEGTVEGVTNVSQATRTEIQETLAAADPRPSKEILAKNPKS